MTTETNDKAATVADQGAHVAPEKVPSKKGAGQKKGAPKAKKSAKAAAPRKGAKALRGRAPKDEPAERTNNKAEVIAMMKRAKGATLAEIVATTGWQKHTVRGFVSILVLLGRRRRSRRSASITSHINAPTTERRAIFTRSFWDRPFRTTMVNRLTSGSATLLC